MSLTDRRPLPDSPATQRIIQRADNRLGAVYSALYSFWLARNAAITGGHQTNPFRRDSYSVIFFDDNVILGPTNDFASSPDELLDASLLYSIGCGTNFTTALVSARDVMERFWSTERCASYSFRRKSKASYATANHRAPVIIFLSDGECRVEDETVQDLSRSAVAHG